VTAGSFGTLVKRNGTIMGLSNNHVWANCNKANKGDKLLQPGSYDSGELPDDKFGELIDYIPVKTISNSNCPVAGAVKKCLNSISKLLGRKTRFRIKTKKVKNEVDAALGKPIDKDTIKPVVLGPQKEDGSYEKLHHRGSRKAKLGEKVWVSGRTLGYKGKDTNARVKSTDATIQVRYPNGIALFTNQVHIKSEKKFSAGGMSGSCVSGYRDGKVIGLLFAGSRSGKSTFLNRIGVVESKLDCRVVDMKKVEE